MVRLGGSILDKGASAGWSESLGSVLGRLGATEGFSAGETHSELYWGERSRAACGGEVVKGWGSWI